jgi:hypothetical protein
MSATTFHPLPAENDVGDKLNGPMFGDAVAERRKVDRCEKRLALPEDNRREGEMQIVDQAGA